MDDDQLPPELLALLQATCEDEAGEDAEQGEQDLTQDEVLRHFQASFERAREHLGAFEPDAMLDGLFGESTVDGRQTPEIDEEDFNPEERPIYRVLRSHMRELVGKNTSELVRVQRLRWLMMPVADRHGVRFDDACVALYSRPIVVRTRALYQMWRNDIALDARLPPIHEPFPALLANEVSMRAGLGVVPGVLEVCRAAWSLPGQPLEVVLADAIERGATNPSRAFAELEANGYVGLTPSGRVYFLTRNPTQMSVRQRARFSWSGSIVGSE